MKDLNLLYVFEALWRDRSVTSAAINLGLSQAAVSGALKRLRAEYGDKLFILVGRKMQPTPLAVSLAPPLLESLSTVRTTSGALGSFDPLAAQNTFVIRMRDLGEVLYLPPLHRRMREVAPSVRLQSVYTSLEDTLQGLATGRIDLALGYLPGLERNIHKSTLFRQGYCCVFRDGHALAKVDMTRERFLAQDHLLVEVSGSGHVLVERALMDAGMRHRIKVRTPQFLSAPHVLIDSDLVWTAPELLVRQLCAYYPLQARPLPLPLDNYEIGMYWHDRYHKDPANKWLREQVVACLDPAALLAAARSNNASQRSRIDGFYRSG